MQESAPTPSSKINYKANSKEEKVVVDFAARFRSSVSGAMKLRKLDISEFVSSQLLGVKAAVGPRGALVDLRS